MKDPNARTSSSILLRVSTLADVPCRDFTDPQFRGTDLRVVGRASPRLLTIRSKILIACLLATSGCGKAQVTLPVTNLRPEVSLSAAPSPGDDVSYSVRLRWTGLDQDGQIEYFMYTVNPPAGGDTSWTHISAYEITLTFPATTPPGLLPPPGQNVIARDQQTFVLKAVDNEGASSMPVFRSFTARTVVPFTIIQVPRPSPVPAATLASVRVRWEGHDSDGPGDRPVRYYYRLVPAHEIHPGPPEEISAGLVQQFFEAGVIEGYAGWDSVGSDTTEVEYEGLEVGRTYFFAVSAIDEAGARESRFLMSSNVSQFRPTTNTLGPRITVFNSFFQHTMTGGISLSPSRIVPVEVPAGAGIAFNWSALAGQGSFITGYRWSLDLEGQDITNETQRTDDSDVRHWSAWSLNETSTLIGPFAGSPDSVETHFLYIEARDNLGFVSLFTLAIRVIVPAFDRPLLLVDDMYGGLSGRAGPYPTEAEQDTFYCAIGGFPDRLAGGTSRPGAFAGFELDTLDYRTYTVYSRGVVPLSVLSRYRVVAWYSDFNSSSGGSDFSLLPTTCLRLMNVENQQNTLAIYLAQGGKALLFGEGATRAIASGFSSRFTRATPNAPYTTQDVLRPGCFLYDFVHLRSELNTAGTVSVQFTRPFQLRGAIPYLPEFAGTASQTDRTQDPRIGTGSTRTALTWTGLPRLTLTNYRGAPSNPEDRSINLTWYISRPLQEPELAGQAPVLDTLYLCQARDFDLSGFGSDGRPNGIHYYGPGHGEVVWLGFPLHYFELDQVRQLVRTALNVLGVSPLNRGRAGATAAAYESQTTARSQLVAD